MSGFQPVKVHRPWGPPQESPEEEPKTAAPRQAVTYLCARACVNSPLEVVLAADVEAPPAWERLCGDVARQPGAPADAKPDTPSYGQSPGGSGKGREIRPGMSYVRERRSEKELEQILDDALRERWNGVAR